MRYGKNLEQPFHPARLDALHVASEDRAEWLLLLPLRMRRREPFDLAHREKKLEIGRLLGPERAVVVEGRDPLGGFDVVGSAVTRDALNEADDGGFHTAGVP